MNSVDKKNLVVSFSESTEMRKRRRKGGDELKRKKNSVVRHESKCKCGWGRREGGRWFANRMMDEGNKCVREDKKVDVIGKHNITFAES